MPTATIKLFLVHGDAKRLRTAELSNWTGKAVAGPRSELDSVLARDEAAKSGVYFLSGTDSESGKAAVYVGEAESIRDRLRGHLDKDFWNHVVFFISKDENLTSSCSIPRGPPNRTGEVSWKSNGHEWPVEWIEASRIRPRRHGDLS